MARMMGGGKSNLQVTKSLGSLVGLSLLLYVFDRIIDSIWSTVNSSTFFGDATALIETIFPVLAIIGVFEVIWRALSGSNLV